MSDQALEPSPVLTLETVADRVTTLATEVATLRESIVTAAEWDADARRARQGRGVSGRRSLIAGGTVATDRAVFPADILIEDGRVAAIGRRLLCRWARGSPG